MSVRDAELFMATLFADQPAGTLISVGSVRSPVCVPTVDEALPHVVGKQDVYVRITLLGRRPKRRGSAADSVAIPGVWVEIDVNGGPKSNGKVVEDGAESIEQAIEIAHSVLEPTLLVRSGYGVHAYWLFDRPRSLPDQDARARSVELVAGWQERLRLESGIKLDATHDLARVLRPPGSFNGKRGGPVPVALLSNGGPRYTVEELTEHVAEHVGHLGTGRSRRNGAGELTGRTPAQLVAAAPRLERIVDRQGRAPRDGSASDWDHYLACEARRQVTGPPLTREEAIGLIAQARSKHPDGKHKEHRRDYLENTVDAAFTAVDASGRPQAASGLFREVTDRLDLASDPVVEVKRWGRHEDSRLVITLRSNRRIVFDRARDAFEPVVLKRRVVLATDGQSAPPTFKKPEAEDVAVKLIRLANVAADADDRDEARDWTGRFLARHEHRIADVADFSTPHGRYEVLSIIRAGRAAVVRDVETEALLVSVSEMARFVRAEAGSPISWDTLHSRLSEVGWKHLGEVEQRQPKGRERAKAHLYAVAQDDA